MARRGSRDGAKTREAIREAAAELFFKHGYEATSLRAVASSVGIQVGSLYNHINGKEELLADIMTSVMNTLEPVVLQAVEDAGPGAVARLRAALDANLRYHAEHARLVFIGNSELRSLTSKDHKAVLARRSQFEALMRGLIEDAAEEAGVDLLDSQMQTFAALALGTHVSSWYRAGGRLELDEVVDIYTRLSLRQLGIDDKSNPRTRKTRTPSRRMAARSV